MLEISVKDLIEGCIVGNVLYGADNPENAMMDAIKKALEKAAD